MPRPVVCQPYYNLLNRMPEVEILPACDHYGLGVAPYSPVARGVLTGKYAPGAPMPEGSRGARGDRRMTETELREESFAIAQKLREHAQKTGRTLLQFALAWLWANRSCRPSSPGRARSSNGTTTSARSAPPWSDEDEALVDSLVTPGPCVHARLQRSAVSVLRPRARVSQKTPTLAMTKSDTPEGAIRAPGSPSREDRSRLRRLIDAKIDELGDWRGERFFACASSSSRRTRTSSRNGSGTSRSGRATASSAPARRTRRS